MLHTLLAKYKLKGLNGKLYFQLPTPVSCLIIITMFWKACCYTNKKKWCFYQIYFVKLVHQKRGLILFREKYNVFCFNLMIKITMKIIAANKTLLNNNIILLCNMHT